MNIDKYEKFEVEDFMEDEYFCYWVLQPESESKLFWQKFIEKYPEKQATINQAKRLINYINGQFKSEIENIPKSKAEKSFRSLSENLNTKEQVVPIRKKVFRWLAAASILLFLGLCSLFFLKGDQPLITYSTGNGQRLNIILPDSTRIQLNANSVLSYAPEKWAENEQREVNLEGEAYFDVNKSREGTHFVVHAGEIDVSVLGTSFNVRTRGETAEVVLAEGKIELSVENQKIAMLPGDLISYSRINKDLVSRKVKPSDYSAWKDGIAIFNNSLKEVTKELEILYGVEFIIKNEELKNRQIQLAVPADSLEQLLEILELMYSNEINIKKEEKQIIIF